MTKKQVRVVAALIRRGEEILVQQRGPGGARGLLWEFPGGKVEAGESEPEALARECTEEMDVVVEVGAKLAEVHHEYADLAVDLVLYASRLVSGTPKALHANELRWVRVQDMAELPFCEADGPFIQALGRGDY
ncbi:MAG: (deoxy)nucleoside triphosphate pyrophosphohydrolase [Myxococcales bacterium]